MINPARPAKEIREGLGLSAHPEGGWYRETFRDKPCSATCRGSVTAILFMLAAGEKSASHRVDAVEIWVWQGGDPLELTIGEERVVLGSNEGQTLQAVVPAHVWQSARPCGRWTLVTCIVAPAFSFDGFELAESNDAQN